MNDLLFSPHLYVCIILLSSIKKNVGKTHLFDIMMDCAVDFDVEPISKIVCKRKTKKNGLNDSTTICPVTLLQFERFLTEFQKYVHICFGFFITLPRDWLKKRANLSSNQKYT